MTGRAHRPWRVAVIVMGAALAAPVVARAQTSISAGASVRMLSGTFGGTETTHVVYAPAVLRADARRFELSVSVPFLTIDSSTVSLSQAGFVPMQGSLIGAPNAGMPMHGGGSMMGQPAGSGTTAINATATRQSGLGDIITSAGYRVVDNSFSHVQLVVGVRVKVPTADAARGLGTGKTDVAGVVAIRKRYDQGWVYAEGGYLAVGQPTGAQLSNVALWNAGAGRRLTDRLYLLGSAAGSTSVVQAFGSPAELGAGVGVKLSQRLVLTVLPSVGLSHASPKYALTVGLSSDMLRR